MTWGDKFFVNDTVYMLYREAFVLQLVEGNPHPQEHYGYEADQ